VTGPASPHRHVQEGICLCETVHGAVVTYSAACGLSSHRVRARAEG
jgi:hypothetical protein